MQKEKFIPTGNEMISLPYVSQSDAAIQGITFLNMGYKGLIEILKNVQPVKHLQPVPVSWCILYMRLSKRND